MNPPFCNVYTSIIAQIWMHLGGFLHLVFAATKRGAAVETTAPLITLIEFVIITVGQRIPVLYLLHCLRI